MANKKQETPEEVYAELSATNTDAPAPVAVKAKPMAHKPSVKETKVAVKDAAGKPKGDLTLTVTVNV